VPIVGVRELRSGQPTTGVVHQEAQASQGGQLLEKATYLVLVGDINANEGAPAGRVDQFVGEGHACILIMIRDGHMPALAMQTPGDDLAETCCTTGYNRK
jgi:hypothetical protein